jgi:hypothetical protein
MASEWLCPSCGNLMIALPEIDKHYCVPCKLVIEQLSLLEEILTTTGEKENGELITKNTEKSE